MSVFVSHSLSLKSSFCDALPNIKVSGVETCSSISVCWHRLRLNLSFYWRRSVRDWKWWRNHVVAPFSEEFTFRACMLPMLLRHYTPTQVKCSWRSHSHGVGCKDERFISWYIVNAIYCIIWKYRHITIIRKYRDILTIFFMSDIDQFWSFMDLKTVANNFFSCASVHVSFY